MALVNNGGAGSPAIDAPTPTATFTGGAGSPVSSALETPVHSSFQNITAPEFFSAPNFPAIPSPLATSFFIPQMTAPVVATTSSADLAQGAGSPGMLPVSSIFSSEPAAGSAVAVAGTSGWVDLPFMHDWGGAELVLYTPLGDTPWIFVSDFSTDWFFA